MNILQKVRKKILQHKVVAIFLMVICLVVIDLVSYRMNPHSSMFMHLMKRYYFTPILVASEDFYKTYDTPLQTDEFMMLLWLWPQRAQGTPRAFTNDPFFRIYSDSWHVNDLVITRRADTRDEITGLVSLFGTETPLYDVGKKYSPVMTDQTDDVVLKALYCDTSGYSDRDYELLSIIRGHDGGYGDTHYLLSLLFLEKLHCSDMDKIAQDKKAVVDDIVVAQKNDDVFSDLFAERVVVLYWAGKGDLVHPQWIKKIVKNIQDDNGWRNSDTDVNDPHITGLSALAIKYFIEGKDLQDVLIK